MSLFTSAAPEPRKKRPIRSALVLVAVGALTAGLFTGPAAVAGENESPTLTGTTEQAVGAIVNISPPVIEGGTEAGGALWSTGGSWQNAQWLHYSWTLDGDEFNTDFLPVGQRSEFEASGSLVGHEIGLTVRALQDPANFEGPEEYATPVTLRTGTFKNVTWDGSIIGKPAIGQALSLTYPDWPNPYGGAPELRYQWHRGVAAIPGATGEKYVVTGADAGQNIWAKMTLVSTGMTPLTLTSKTVTIAKGTFTASPAPALSGTAKVGHKLTANPGNWSPAGATLAYQWYRGDTPINGATSRSYTATAADNGKYLKVRVRASKAGYNTLDRWSVTRKVTAGSIVATKRLSVAGSARYGQTVKVSQGWTPGSKVSYQWYRNGKALKGGTKHYLYLSSGYINSKVSVRVTVSKSGYTTRKSFSPAVAVGKANITAKSAPKISGTKKAGHKLTASPGSFSPRPSSYGYQWYRNGKAISGAKYRTYKVTSADNGKKITVKVSARKANHNTRASMSSAVTIPAPPRTVIRSDGTYKLKPGLYKATGSGNSCYWETLSGFSGSFSNINSNHFGSARTYIQITAADKGFRTQRCGQWTTAPSTGTKASKITSDGTYRVGIDIKPGTYYGYSSGKSCYWATLDSFSGYDNIIANHFGSARVIITVPSSAKGFEVSRCGTLTRR